MEVTSALQSEQHVKKELAKKLGQLQENLGELKETVSNSSRMAGQVCSSSCKGELATDQTLMERWKLVLVTITLGALPCHLLSDAGDQHVGTDGGCLPRWWLWGSIDGLDHATRVIVFSGRNDLI